MIVHVDAIVGQPENGSTSDPIDHRFSSKFGYLKTSEAAAYVGLSPRTLEKHRCYGTGPVYRKLGGRVVYRFDELDAWVELGTRTSTSDPGRGVVRPARRISNVPKSCGEPG